MDKGRKQLPVVEFPSHFQGTPGKLWILNLTPKTKGGHVFISRFESGVSQLDEDILSCQHMPFICRIELRRSDSS